MKKEVKNEELVTDPRELLLSLVDMGSLDIEDALMACVKEMSDAECKRVLSGLSLPNCCDMEDDAEVAVEEPAEDEFPSDDEAEEDSDEDEMEIEVEEAGDEEDVDAEEDDDEAELEARIRRLERALKTETMNRNRIRKFPYHKINR